MMSARNYNNIYIFFSLWPLLWWTFCNCINNFPDRKYFLVPLAIFHAIQHFKFVFFLEFFFKRLREKKNSMKHDHAEVSNINMFHSFIAAHKTPENITKNKMCMCVPSQGCHTSNWKPSNIASHNWRLTKCKFLFLFLRALKLWCKKKQN